MNAQREFTQKFMHKDNYYNVIYNREKLEAS